MRHLPPGSLVALALTGAGSFLWIGCKGVPPGLPTNPTMAWHTGPDVELAETGPARFVLPLGESFNAARAMESVRYMEGLSLAPGNPAFDDLLDYVAGVLRSAGFDGKDPRLLLEFIETEMDQPTWTPLGAKVELLVSGKEPLVLHSFSAPGDADRCMLPVYAPSCDVEGPVVLQLGDIEPGSILVTNVPLRQVLDRAGNRGAAAVVSASAFDFCIDPSGADRHLDAIQYRTLSADTKTPVAQISPRSYREIELACLQKAHGDPPVRLGLHAEVHREQRPLRTLVATIVGAERPEEAVATAAHAQEWGACDNSSGVAGLAEGVRTLSGLLRTEALPWPSRTLVYIWGDEIRESEIWLAHTEREPVAGISCDMVGESKATGAVALLERGPDPGALSVYPPDFHTPWGSGDVDEDLLEPNGLAVIARCAMVDVGLATRGGWPSAEHPWEGGSDHDAFFLHGIPGVLIWHFTDFIYHTSLDRLEFVDSDELHRTMVAILSLGLAVADAQPGDLARYLESLAIEREVRVAAALAAKNEELAGRWKDWSLGARQWLRNHCLGIDEDLPEPRESSD